MLVLLSPRAWAEAPMEEPPPEGWGTDEQVMRHFQLGQGHYKAGRYGDAVRELLETYQLSHDAQLLFSVGSAYRKGQRYREARDTYQRYLREDPATLLRDETLAHIENLGVIIKRQEDAERERRKPLWKKGWFWGIVGSAAAVIGVGLGAGLSLGLRDDRFVYAPRAAALDAFAPPR